MVGHPVIRHNDKRGIHIGFPATAGNLESEQDIWTTSGESCSMFTAVRKIAPGPTILTTILLSIVGPDRAHIAVDGSDFINSL